MIADNQTDKFLTVGGLRVLGDVTSNNLKKLENQVQDTFDKTQSLTAQQKDFWNNLADDSLITPVEKKQIKQEISIIEKTYQAIHKKAQEVGQEFNPLFTSYATAYRELKDYIIELKLFDNMNENTRVNKTEFSLKFSDYYELESVVQSVFLGKSTYTMRVLSSLNDEGTEGEVAIYRNIFYRRENEKWVLITGDTYLGLQKSVPANGSLGDFFLAEEDFTGQIKYKARGKYLKANGKFLTTAKKFKKGFIYKLEPTGWKAVENKNDHRYVIATEDLIEIGETISLHLQKWFTDIDDNFKQTAEELKGYNERFVLIDADLDGINEKYQIVDGELKGNKEDIKKINGKIVEIDTDLDGINEQFVVVDGKLVEINGKIVEIETDLALKIEVIPKYLGAVDTLPTTKFKGDWFTWKAESTNEYVKGKVYMWNGEAWKLLDPTDTTNNQQFMTALTDILKTNATGEGYFSTIFASALIASNAFIQNLQSQIITLTQDLNADGTPKENTGIIQSKNYLETNGKEGWQIRADGSADFKQVTLDNIKSKNASFTNSSFNGNLDCGNLKVQKKTITTEYKTIYSEDRSYLDSFIDIEPTPFYLELFGISRGTVKTTITREITTLIGEGGVCFYGSEKVEIQKLRIICDIKEDPNGTTGTVSLYGIKKDGTETLIFKTLSEFYYNGLETKQTQYGVLALQIEKTSSLVLCMENLPTTKPLDKGLVWNDNGTVKVT